MRISDWSSDVCSSDLEDARQVEIAVGSDPAEAVVIDRADRGGGKAQQEAVESAVVKQPPQLRRRLVGIGAAEVGATAEVLERASVVQHAADLAQADLPDGWRADHAPEAGHADDDGRANDQIGRASRRERVCQNVEILGVAGSITKNDT